MNKKSIEKFIEEDISPALASHNGHIRLVGVDEESGIVAIEMSGGCQGCAGAKQTLQFQIEMLLKDEFPSIKQVIDTTDHSSGQNPFY